MASVFPRTTVGFVRRVWKDFISNSGLEPRLLSGLKVEAAKPGAVLMKMKIEQYHLNRVSILHGGTIASIVDLAGSLAVASRGLFSTGVSTDLNVTYLSAGGKVGDTILVQATCEKFGKSLAYTSVSFYHQPTAPAHPEPATGAGVAALEAAAAETETEAEAEAALSTAAGDTEISLSAAAPPSAKDPFLSQAPGRLDGEGPLSGTLQIDRDGRGGPAGPTGPAAAEDEPNPELAAVFARAGLVPFARGSHTKYIALGWKDERNRVGELE